MSRAWAPPEGAATRLILVRHGATALTAQRRYSGRGDVELSEIGVGQAVAAARRVGQLCLSPPVVVSSPLRRCIRTAEAIGWPAVVAALIECDFGEWDGLTFDEVRERWPAELAAWLADSSVAPPGGESLTEVAARVAPAVAALVEEHAGRTVVLVSHVTPIKLVLRDALVATDDFLHRMFLDAAGISLVDYYADGRVAVRAINDTSHLAAS